MQFLKKLKDTISAERIENKLPLKITREPQDKNLYKFYKKVFIFE